MDLSIQWVEFSISDEKAILDQHAKFYGKYLGKRGYVGQFGSIGSNVKVGEMAVVHEHAGISYDSFKEIKPTKIAITLWHRYFALSNL